MSSEATFSYRPTSIGQPAKTYIHQLCADIECHPEDLSKVMAYRDEWQESQGNLCCQHTLMMMSCFWELFKLLRGVKEEIMVIILERIDFIF